MIGRLNHVAIAVRDIAKAAQALSRHARRRGLGRRAAAGARRHHGVHHAAEHQDRAAGAARRRIRRSRNSSSAIRTAASTTSATRWTTSSPRATSSRRRARACSATASRRSARTASRCCSCIRRISAARWSSSSRREMQVVDHRGRDLFPDLVDRAVRRAAVGRAQPARGRRDVEPGTDPGAPTIPALGRKLIWTTVVATSFSRSAMWSTSTGL